MASGLGSADLWSALPSGRHVTKALGVSLLVRVTVIPPHLLSRESHKPILIRTQLERHVRLAGWALSSGLLGRVPGHLPCVTQHWGRLCEEAQGGTNRLENESSEVMFLRGVNNKPKVYRSVQLTDTLKTALFWSRCRGQADQNRSAILQLKIRSKGTRVWEGAAGHAGPKGQVAPVAGCVE